MTENEPHKQGLLIFSWISGCKSLHGHVSESTDTGQCEQKDGVIHSIDTTVLDLLESIMKPHLKSSAEDSNN